MTWKKTTPAILAFVLSALVLAVFYQAVGFELLTLDDPTYTVENPIVKGGLTGDGVKAAFTQVWERYWLPATWISYMADVEVFGLKPSGFHLTNVLLHLSNALLLFALLHRTTGAGWKSFFAAALWAIHPLRAESVAWVTERKDVLSGFFFLLALLSHVEYAKSGKKLWLGAVTACAILGLMAKPVVMVLPVALLLLDFWPLDRFPKEYFKKNFLALKVLFLEKAHLFLLSVIFVLITLKAQKIDDALRAGLTSQKLDAGGILENFAGAIKGYCAYFYETLWPVGLYLRGSEQKLTFGVPLTVLCLIFLVLVSVLAIKYRNRFPELAFGWFWYLLILFPNSGIVQAGVSTFSDRFTYLPHLGLMVALVWGAERVFGRFFRDLRPLAAAGGIITVVLAVLCFRQVAVWRDNFTFFGRNDLMSGGKSAMTKKNLGIAYYNAGRYREAYDLYSQALAFAPYLYHGNLNKGFAAEKLGRYREAAELYRMELRVSPGDRYLCILIANNLLWAGDLPGAARQALQNVRQWPNDPAAWEAINNLGGEARAKALAGQ